MKSFKAVLKENVLASMPHEFLHSELHNHLTNHGYYHQGTLETPHYTEHKYQHPTHQEDTFPDTDHGSVKAEEELPHHGWVQDHMASSGHDTGNPEAGRYDTLHNTVYRHPNGAMLHMHDHYKDDSGTTFSGASLRIPK